MGRLAVQVRRPLGDGTVDVRAVGPTETFTAASLKPPRSTALYALYASDFDTAAQQVALVRSLIADYPDAQLATTMIDVAAGRWNRGCGWI